MTAIIPMFLPSPYSVQRGYFYDGSAVRDQTRQQAEHHSQLMGAIRELGKSTITVAVLSSAVLPLCNAALTKLEGPAADYDRALSNWYSRVNKVRAWQGRRRKAKEKRDAEAWAAEKERFQADYIRAHSRWWRSSEKVLRDARRATAEKFLEPWPYHHARLSGLSDARLQWARSRPRPPSGYDDLPAVRDLQSAASISPDAQLTVPVETVKRLMRWAA